jgi:hypothetical protein
MIRRSFSAARRRRAGLLLPASLLALLCAPDARAGDAEVTADAQGQFYDVRSPGGTNILERRRLTAMVGVSGYDLLEAPPSDPRAPNISLRARLRYDADYGANSETSDPNQNGANGFVPGFTPGSVDLMYAYIEGRRFFKGLMGFKLGRQYVTDVLGWWSFDGGEVSVATPFFVKAEVYGGLEQRGGMPLSTSRFQGDGVWVGDRSGLPAGSQSLYPAFQPVAAGPAFGAAIESTGVTWIHGRLTYRRVYNTGGSNVTEFTPSTTTPATYEGWRISSEKLGYAMDANWSSVGGLKGGLIYDLYRTDITQGYASLEGYIGTKVTIGADFDYYVPSFDADSIWNFFAAEPRSDAALRAEVTVDRHLSFSGNGHVRIFTVQTAPFAPVPGTSTSAALVGAVSSTYFPTNGHPFDEGGNLSARWRKGNTTLGFRGAGDFGDEGDRVGGDVSGEHVIETRYVVGGRVGVWQWDDKLRPDRSTTSGNYVASLGYRFAAASQAMVDWEHDINSLVGQRFRVMVSLKLGVTK